MADSKASRLQVLSERVSVPFFRVLARGDSFDSSGLAACRYMVRSSTGTEDQADFSCAGQSTTLGPVSLEQVPASIEQLWKDDNVVNIIVQEYVEAAQWGVAFCFSKDSMLVEYSGVFEGVTSGQISPFTALLPAGIARYRALYDQLLKIVEAFGPCDVEFLNLEQPQFVQVRPITREIAFDPELVTLKMQLQELESEHWHQNDICHMLAERDEYSRPISELYLQAVKAVYSRYLNRELDIPEPAFIKISEQYFMDESLEMQLVPGLRGTLGLALKLPAALAAISSREQSDRTLMELMTDSILLSLAYELSKKDDIFNRREAIRAELEQRMSPQTLTADFHFENTLSDTIQFDKKQCCWLRLDLRDRQGITVVPGDFDNGPYFHLKQREQPIPNDVIVVTTHLYPEIGKSIRGIKGIICKHGALSSHVAILAREYNVPLKIQAPIDGYE